MSERPTRSAVLRANDAFREQVKHLAAVAMNTYGVVWRDIDLDEISIAAANKLRLYQRVCDKLKVIELGETQTAPASATAVDTLSSGQK